MLTGALLMRKMALLERRDEEKRVPKTVAYTLCKTFPGDIGRERATVQRILREQDEPTLLHH